MSEPALVLLIGLFFVVAVYLLLSRALIRMLLGVVLLGNGVNLLILVAGRLTREVPPLIPPGASVPAHATANPLPQALILTAIVIGFGMFVFLLVLAFRTYQTLEADDTDQMRVAEPRGGPQPPLSY
jgi:multicomponent Na+:H+ antiporter subunit C